MLARFVKGTARRIGLDVRRYRPPEARRAERIRNTNIAVVLDVGASRGQYGASLREYLYRGRIISFEPVAAAFAELAAAAQNDELWECHNIALGDKTGEFTLNVASNLASSSFLPMRDEHRKAFPAVAYTSTEQVRMGRLDDLDLGINGPALLKLDVQGFEDRVLRGAVETLVKVELIECEISLAYLYEGQPSFRDMIERFHELGFAITDLDPFFYDPADGRVLSIDATFSRVDPHDPPEGQV